VRPACGERTARDARHRETPGIARALGRILIYAMPFTLPSLVRMLFFSASELRLIAQRGDGSVTDWIWFPLTIALFVTMRARNGYAAIHDLITRTRVIVRPKTQPRPALAALETSAAPMAAHADAPRKFGPYDVTGTLWKTADAELALAFDSALRRKVWIHLAARGTAAGEARRDLSRAARLRWLDGGVANGASWNAYEALEGAPLLAITQRPHSWNSVRFWLLDLAEECSAAAERPESAPVLALDRLWITASGHAVVLEFPAPGLVVAPGSLPIKCTDSKEVQEFLATVARMALNGSAASEAPGASLIPLHARQFLTSLAQRSFDEARFIVGNLRSLTTKPAEVTRARRGASVMFVPAATIVLAAFFAAILTFERTRWDHVWKAHYPGEPSLRVAAEILVDDAEDSKGDNFDAKDYALVSAYIAKHFAPVLTNEAFWSAQPALTMVPNLRERVRESVTMSSTNNFDFTPGAERGMARRMAKAERAERLAFLRIAGYVATGIVILMALIDCIAALAFRVVPVLRMFGIAVVNRAGIRASRGRVLWRAIVLWLPTTIIVTVMTTLIAGITRENADVSPRTATIVSVALLAALIAAMIYAARRPAAGPHDCVAGTRLVPM
jgi:eukaryotic-like serine/threonine-protein kinase